jgi:transcriptional regulator with XRE-family HTH domain
VNGRDVSGARKARGLKQEDLAAKLGVSQGYVSLLERNHRAVPSRLAAKLASVLNMAPTTLPMRDAKSLQGDQAAKALGALGYEPFGYLASSRRLNPAEVLVAVLRADDVDARIVEALPWLLVRYADLNWEWVVRTVKQDDGQNRLGFVLSLGKGLAESLSDSKAAASLGGWEQRLEKSRLQEEDTFSRHTLTKVELKWLRAHRSPEAKRWNLLSTLSVESLQHVS